MVHMFDCVDEIESEDREGVDDLMEEPPHMVIDEQSPSAWHTNTTGGGSVPFKHMSHTSHTYTDPLQKYHHPVSLTQREDHVRRSVPCHWHAHAQHESRLT